MQNTLGPRIILDAPVVVSQAPIGLKDWGPWQFPAIQRLPDGRLQIGYHIAEDSASAYGTAQGVTISDDNGQSWKEVKADEALPSCSWTSKTLILPNGDLLHQVQLKSRKLEDIQEKLPLSFTTCTGGYGEKITLYSAEKMPKELAGYRFSRFKKGIGKWIEETADVNMPGAVRGVTSGVLTFPWIHRIKIAPDGTLWGISHSRRVVDGVLQKYTAVCIIRSLDNGRTWNLLSEIAYQPDKKADRFWDKREGFTEPNITFLPDGSIFCLIRTTDGKGVGPLYMSRSTDNGKTWNTPAVFDDSGVWPALLTLKNGVTLASYGRPGLYIRATDDPADKSWGCKVAIVNPGELHKDTCSYSDLIALNGQSALIVYSDFNYPDKQGKPRKTILVRKITLK